MSEHEVTAEQWLAIVGERIRSARRAQGVSATVAAMAAGVSRVTWHRLEAGSPSVAAGSYARALEALGIADEVTPGPQREPATGKIPTRIRVGDWPQLAALSWSLQPSTLLTPTQALAIYERNIRHLDESVLSAEERALIDVLREGLADHVRA